MALAGFSPLWLNRTALTWATCITCAGLIWRSMELSATNPLMQGVVPVVATGAFTLWGTAVGAYLGVKTLADKWEKQGKESSNVDDQSNQ